MTGDDDDCEDGTEPVCSTCGDEGLVDRVRGAMSSTCDPGDVEEVPCDDCERGRALAEELSVAACHIEGFR